MLKSQTKILRLAQIQICENNHMYNTRLLQSLQVNFMEMEEALWVRVRNIFEASFVFCHSTFAFSCYNSPG